ncbi:unnamed protein product [Mucor hiemalis]
MQKVNYPGVQLSWRRVVSIAKNTPDPAAIDEDFKYEDDNNPEINHASSRMQCMGRALQNMYTITSQAEGYTAFISTMIHELSYQCPVSMTFLKHIVDFSEIPSKTTIQNTTEALLTNATTADERINQCIIWSLLARKFAGNLTEAMWKDDIATILIDTLADSYTDHIVKLYALLALDSFALTGNIKTRILNNSSCILSTLNKNLNDCQTRLSDFNENQQSPLSSNITDSPNLTLASSLQRKYSGKKFYHHLLDKKTKIFNKLKKNKRSRKTTSKSVDQTGTTSTLIPLSDIVREEWSGLMQLQHCFQWSMDNIFNHSKSLFTPRVTTPGVQLNREDCTSHCKLSSNCLDMRNDTFFLESARGNTCVETGVWYYEVLLLTDGVIQIGWGTSKCLFLPEEGCGVGDDPNGFSFDTFRSAIWAASEAVYPQGTEHTFRCKIGDVLGSLLDMDKGTCTFFLNGRDFGLKVQFHKNIRKQNALGLYPIISLANHQHVIVNFGDQPWMYTPPVQSTAYLPMSCSKVKKEETSSTMEKSNRKYVIDNEVHDHDWDGPLCTLCFSEPKDTVLLPCKHDGFGRSCTNKLESW